MLAKAILAKIVPGFRHATANVLDSEAEDVSA